MHYLIENSPQVNEIKNENEKEDTKSDWTAKESDMAASSGQSEKTNTQHTSGFSPEEIAILQVHLSESLTTVKVC